MGTAAHAKARRAPSALRELGLDLVGRNAARRGGDRARRPPVVVLHDEIEKRTPDQLGVRPAERKTERAVRADTRVVGVAIADRTVAREHDHHARDRLEHCRLHVSLALELTLPLAAHRDVDPSGDDRGDGSGLNRGTAPFASRRPDSRRERS